MKNDNSKFMDLSFFYYNCDTETRFPSPDGNEKPGIMEFSFY